MTKKLIIICIGVLFTPLFCFSQLWEVGVMLGGSTYNGELTPGLIALNEINPAGGAIVRANINKYFTVKGNVYYGTISGDDRYATNPKSLQRNLNFKSNILDVGVNGEVNLTGFDVTKRDYHTSPYLFLGIAVFNFDPLGFDSKTNQWVRLQPLGTEGQGTPRYNVRTKYALTQISIPFGIGLKHNISEHFNLGVEFGLRKTFTDYLDDVSSTYVDNQYLSQFSGALAARMAIGNNSMNKDFTSTTLRGNPNTDDWYMFGGIIISYNILPAYCPHF